MEKGETANGKQDGTADAARSACFNDSIHGWTREE